MRISLSLDTRCVSDACTVPVSGHRFPIKALTVSTFLLLNLVVVPTSQWCRSWTCKPQSAPSDPSIAFEVVTLKFLL